MAWEAPTQMIRYSFTFDENTTITFEVEVGSDTSAEDPPAPVPGWLALDQHTCPDCALPVGSRRTCPAAVSIRPVVEAFSNRLSYETVHVVVTGPRGRLEHTMATQGAVRSLVGLLLALSSCPVMQKLRPMAQHHLPFGDQSHTMFRFVGMYLIAQYLRTSRGKGAPDWELAGLLGLFNELHQVNKRLAERIRAASQADAAVNSLIFLDTFATSVEIDVEDCLVDLEPHFAAYLD